MALKHLKKLGRQAQVEIIDYMHTRIARSRNPREFGKPLRHEKFGLWRYRLREYRIICEIYDKRLVVLVLAIGHRSTVYEE